MNVTWSRQTKSKSLVEPENIGFTQICVHIYLLGCFTVSQFVDTFGLVMDSFNVKVMCDVLGNMCCIKMYHQRYF